MKKELEVFIQIENQSGNGSQKIKQNLISDNLSEKMEYLLDVCFNPFVTTKLHKINLIEYTPGRKYSRDPEEFWNTFKQLVEELKQAPAANDSLRQRAEDLIDHTFSPDTEEDMGIRKMLMKVLTKRMNIGLGAKLINKAVGREKRKRL